MNFLKKGILDVCFVRQVLSKMKYVIVFLPFLTLSILSSCSSYEQKNTKVLYPSTSTPSITPTSQAKLPLEPETSTIEEDNVSTSKYDSDTSFIINELNVIIQTKEMENSDLLLIQITNGDSVIIDTIMSSNALSDMWFTDFNKDGNMDIMFSYLGNNPYHLLYLFNPKTSLYTEIKDYGNFSDSKQLTNNPKLYFSYHRAGCADYNWESDLFKIDNYEIIHLGNLYGNGCEADSLQYIKTSRGKYPNNTKVDSLSYYNNVPEFGDKWDFIEKYWNNNWQKFSQ